MLQSILNNIAFIFASLISLGLIGSGAWLIWKVSKRDSQISNQNIAVLAEITNIADKVSGMETKLNRVCEIVGYQFQKNGGGSTTDKIDRIESTLNDISERQILDFYLDNQPKYECNANGHCIRVNYAWREITGLSEEDAQGDQWIKAVHPKDREFVKREWENFLDRNLPFECEYRLVNPNTLHETLVFGKAIKKFTGDDFNLIIGTFEIKPKKNSYNDRMVKAA